MPNTVVITGANRGIGLALVQEYHERGDTVYALCRTPSEALLQTPAQIVTGIDVSNGTLQKQLRAELAGIKVDILINNAGILRDESLGHIDYGTVLEQFEVNAMGPLKVTEALAGQLAPSAKVALITSRMGSVADNSSGGRYGYRMSKAALNMAGVSLAHDLKPAGVAVAILHPGFVQTDMVGHRGDISAHEAARRLMARIDALTLENTGTFWHSNGEVLPW